MEQQAKQARRRSRGKMPVMLFVILIALAAAGAAFATYYVYTTFIAPAQQERTAVEQPAEDPDAEERAQKAVYNDVLSAYKDAQDNGWPAGSSDADLANLSDVRSGRASFMGVANSVENDWTLEYTYKDLDSDGTLDLVIAVVNGDEYYPMGVYANTGGSANSLTKGQGGGQTSAWGIHKGGYLDLGWGGYSAGGIYYSIADGEATEIGSFSMQGGTTGESLPEDATAYEASDFDWAPVAEYSPVE